MKKSIKESIKRLAHKSIKNTAAIKGGNSTHPTQLFAHNVMQDESYLESVDTNHPTQLFTHNIMQSE